MYPNLLPLIFFSIAAAFTPGPNNIVGSYSGFNFGIKRSIPLILGVTFGYTTLITLSAAGLNVIFTTYPILKTIIKVIGSLFLIYLAYKISFQNQIKEKIIKNPVTFYDTFIFQFVNPKGVFAAITSISLFVATRRWVLSSSKRPPEICFNNVLQSCVLSSLPKKGSTSDPPS